MSRADVIYASRDRLHHLLLLQASSPPKNWTITSRLHRSLCFLAQAATGNQMIPLGVPLAISNFHFFASRANSSFTEAAV
jgi:hypothetical protein